MIKSFGNKLLLLLFFPLLNITPCSLSAMGSKKPEVISAYKLSNELPDEVGDFHYAVSSITATPVKSEKMSLRKIDDVAFNHETGEHILLVGTSETPSLHSIVAATTRGLPGSLGLITVFQMHQRRVANFNEQDRNGRTPLFFARMTTMVDDLIRYGANINAQDNSGLSAFDYFLIFYAAANGPERRDIYGPILERFIQEEGVEVNERSWRLASRILPLDSRILVNTQLRHFETTLRAERPHRALRRRGERRRDAVVQRGMPPPGTTTLEPRMPKYVGNSNT